MTLNGALAGMVSDTLKNDFPFIIFEREKCSRCPSVLAATFMNPGLPLLWELGAVSASSVSTLSCSSKLLGGGVFIGLKNEQKPSPTIRIFVFLWVRRFDAGL